MLKRPFPIPDNDGVGSRFWERIQTKEVNGEMAVGKDEQNDRQEMGYHGSNMHGYSMTKKENKLDRYAGNQTVRTEEQGEQTNELS